MTPLTKLLVESREEFKEKCSYDGVEIDGDVDAFIDSLVRKAYLLGLERAKEATKGRSHRIKIGENEMAMKETDMSLNEIRAFNAFSNGHDEGYDKACKKIEEALDSAIGEITE